MRLKGLLGLSVAIACCLVVLTAAHPLLGATVRHVNELEPSITLDEARTILKSMLEQGELRELPDVYRAVKGLYDALERGNEADAEMFLRALRSALVSNSISGRLEGLSPDIAYSLAQVSSWRVGSDLTITVDPMTLAEMLKLIQSSSGTLDYGETIETLRELSSLLKEYPELSGGFKEAADLIEAGRYEEAQEVYASTLSSLYANLDEIISEGVVDPETLKFLLSKLPSSLESIPGIGGSVSSVQQETPGGAGDVYFPRLPQPSLPSLGASPKIAYPGFGLDAGWALRLAPILLMLLAIFYLVHRSGLGKRAVEAGRRIIYYRRVMSKISIGPAEKDLRELVVEVYRTAVRYLSASGYPHMPHMTPREYLALLHGKSFYPSMEALTWVYEKAVYSGYGVERGDYELALKSLREILGGAAA